MRKMSLPAPTPKPPKGGFNSLRQFGIIILLITLCSYKTFAQEVIINNTTLLIAEGKYNDAEKYLDSIIKAEPQNVTAQMMKGNVLLNYALMQTPGIHRITPQDESIFSPDVVTLNNNIVVIPKATALKVEALWKKCIALDSTRLDIRKGLCSLYGMALMHDELVSYLPKIARAGKDKGPDFWYTLVEYAHLLHERGDKEGSYLVYNKIAELYPTVSGIYCIMAESYFTNGDLDKSVKAARRGVTTVNADLTVCRDAIDIYTAIATTDEVLPILKIASKDSSYKDYFFYKGLYDYTRGEGDWKVDIRQYMNQPGIVHDSIGVYAAAMYMGTNGFGVNYESMMGLMNYNINDFGSKLVIRKLTSAYKDSTAPYLIAVPILINDKSYTEANVLLSTLSEKMPADPNILYFYGYSLYQAGNYKTAIEKWSKYAELSKKSGAAQDAALAAPYYFLGQSYMKSGNAVKALEYFKLIEAGKDESKYAYMAKLMIDQIAVKR